MKFGIVTFPGTWSDYDVDYTLRDVLGQQTESIWHKDTDLKGVDAVVIPGGFSYGDYLRAGAIARFSPIMGSIKSFAADGGTVIGICNGFQILCEAGLLPGVLIRNERLKFICKWVNLRIENGSTRFSNTATSQQLLRIPISHAEGNYYADSDTLQKLNDENRVLFRYASPKGDVGKTWNPNGSVENIAGIVNEAGNVMGMMPHPEKACHEFLGGSDGNVIFRSIIQAQIVHP